MRLGELNYQLEEMYMRLVLRARREGVRFHEMPGDINDPEIVIENRLGTRQCGTIKVSGIQSIRTINNQIVITLDH